MTGGVTYLIRHARTEYSTRYLVNGETATDVPLSPAGEDDCRALAAR